MCRGMDQARELGARLAHRLPGPEMPRQHFTKMVNNRCSRRTIMDHLSALAFTLLFLPMFAPASAQATKVDSVTALVERADSLTALSTPTALRDAIELRQAAAALLRERGELIP